MRLSRIEVKNFKTFEDICVDFNDSNLLIGSCASGKSNFVEIFDFLKDLSQNFEKAFREHGSAYLQNLNLNSKDNPTCLKISFDDKKFERLNLTLTPSNLDENEKLSIEFTNFSYEVCVNFKKWEYEILSENVEFAFDVYKYRDDDFEVISQNKLYLKNLNGQFIADLEKSEEYFTVDDLVPVSSINIAQNSYYKHNVSLINSVLASVPVPWVFIFNDIECYNFNPQFSKGVSKINGENNLLKYGENLAVILYRIFEDEENKRLFLNLVHDLLPYVDNIEVSQINDNQLFFAITEQNNSLEIPSFFISDGTSNVISLIVSLYFDDSKYVFIEEPERNIHPSLLSKVVEMIKEASQYKQIIVTTHSPELLKNIDLEDVFFIFKDNNGFSKITRPIDNDVILPFIEELGIDKIFVNNYLRWGNE